MFDQPIEEDALNWNDTLYKTIMSPSDSGGAMSIVDSVSPPRSGPPMHVHKDEDEAFIVISGEVEFCVVVEGLAEKRGPAKVAETLYRETEESVARREAAAAARRQQRELRAASAGRPGKRERRQLTDLKRFDGED